MNENVAIFELFGISVRFQILFRKLNHYSMKPHSVIYFILFIEKHGIAESLHFDYICVHQGFECRRILFSLVFFFLKLLHLIPPLSKVLKRNSNDFWVVCTCN